LNGKPTVVGGSPVEQKMELDSGNEATESIDLRFEALLVCAYPEQPDILRCLALIYQRLAGNDVDKVLWFMSRPRNRLD